MTLNDFRPGDYVCIRLDRRLNKFVYGYVIKQRYRTVEVCVGYDPKENCKYIQLADCADVAWTGRCRSLEDQEVVIMEDLKDKNRNIQMDVLARND